MKTRHWLLLVWLCLFVAACWVTPEDQAATDEAIIEANDEQATAIAKAKTPTADPTQKPAQATEAAQVLPMAKAHITEQAGEPGIRLTLDGYDKDAGIMIQDINLWKDYNNRAAGVAAVGKHGQRVKLIRWAGDGVLIELPSGEQGWVTYYFIKEYK